MRSKIIYKEMSTYKNAIKMYFDPVSHLYNRIFNKKKVYKCVAYIKDGDKNDMVDAFEIEDFSTKKAHNIAYDVLKLKYPNMGFDIRISTK